MRLRLVTYNIHKGVGSDGHLRLDRIVEVIRHYDADVVLLQEVLWRATPHATQPQELAAGLAPMRGVVALNCTRRIGTYGNMTLTRHPISVHENVDLTLPMRKPRAALYTRIELPFGPLHVFNVHLGLSAWERRLQAMSVVHEIEHVCAPHEPLVVAGDFNDWRNRIFPQVLAGEGFYCPPGREDDPGHATYPSRYPLGALDRVFCRGAVHAVRATPSRLALCRVASDHLPVVAELDVGPR